MIRKLAVTLFTLLLGVTLLSAPAQAAPAPEAAAPPAVTQAQGPACTYSFGIICGRITNNSNIGIGIIPNWGPDWEYGYGGGGWKAILWPGENSSKYYQDTDGVFVGRCWIGQIQVFTRYGWKTQATFAGPRNYKIPDTNTYRINSWAYC